MQFILTSQREINFRFWNFAAKEMFYWEKAKYAFLSYVFNGPDWMPMQYTGMADKNGDRIFEGDLLYVPYGMTWLNGDGKLLKGMPRSLDGFCQVLFEQGGFEFKWLGAIKAHKYFEEKKFYRCYSFGKSITYAQGVAINKHVEIIGNIYEDFDKELDSLIPKT